MNIAHSKDVQTQKDETLLASETSQDTDKKPVVRADEQPAPLGMPAFSFRPVS